MIEMEARCHIQNCSRGYLVVRYNLRAGDHYFVDPPTHRMGRN
jgi:hypothetical protein